MSVFAGYANVANNESVNIDISGFKTPTGGPVKTEIGVVSYEGDLGLVGDSFSISRKVGSSWGPAQQISDPARPATNFFNSTISEPVGQHVSTKSPNYQNQLGFDVGRIDASGKLASGDTDARLTASSKGDVYYPSAITFATELFAPNMPTAKSAVDLNGGDLKPGDTVRYTIVAQNKGQDALDASVLTDTFPAGTTYVPGSLQINSTGGHDGDITGRQLTSDLGNLAIGAQITLTYDLTINADTPSGTILRNTATLSGNGHDTGIAFTFPSNEVVLTVTNPNATLSLNKVGVDQVPGTPGVQFGAGADAEYHLTLTNNGPDVADPPLVVSDPLPSGQDFVSASGAGWGCTFDTGARVVTCTRNAGLASGASAPVITVTVNVPAATPDGTTQSNTATATSTTPGTPGTDTENVTVVQRNDLAIIKAVDGTPVAGGRASWNLSVKNNGPAVVSSVQVQDTLPAGVSYFDAIGTDWSCANPSGTVTCNYSGGTLGAGEQAPMITLTGTLSQTAGTVANTATVSGSGTDTDPSNNTSTETFNAANQIDAAVTITVPGTVPPGGSTTATVTSLNYGPSAIPAGATVSMTIDIPADVTVTSLSDGSWGCSPSTMPQVGPVTLTCSQTLVAAKIPGATFDTISFGVDLSSGAPPLSVVLTAEITAPQDINLSNNKSVVNIRGVALADIALTSTSDVTVTAGGPSAEITYTVKNNGPSSDPGDFEVTIPLPAAITATSAGGGWVCGPNAGLFKCTKSMTLANGASDDLKLNVSAGPSAKPADLAMIGSVTSPTDDPELANNEATALVHVITHADLVAAKNASPNPILAGQDITYTLSVTNNGPSTAVNAQIADDFSGKNLDIASVTPPLGMTCIHTAINLTCTTPSLAVGATATVTVKVSSNPGIPHGTVIANTSHVSSETPGNSDTAEANVTVNRSSTLTMTKVAVDESGNPITTAIAGSLIHYRIRVSNSGPSTATGVTVTDPLPANITYISSEGPDWACSYAAPTVTCADSTLTLAPSTDAPDIIITGIVDSFATGSLTNTATATPLTPGTPGTDTEVTPIRGAVDLAVVHGGEPAVNAGGTWHTTVDVFNFGPSGEPGPVTVEITLSSGATDPAGSGTGWTCALSAPKLTCTNPTGVPHNSGLPTINITSTANPSATELFSTAVVSGSGTVEDTNPDNQVDSTNAQILGVADMGIVKSVSGPSSVPVGQNVTFNLTVTNYGPSAAAAIITTDTLGAGLTYVPTASDARCANEAGPLSCSAASMAAGESTTFTIVATVTQQGTLTNTATVSSSETDPNPDNNTSSATVTGTDPLQPQIPDQKPPPTIKPGGTTTIVKGRVYSNAGQRVKIKVTCRPYGPAPRGDIAYCKVTYKKNGKITIRTYGKRIKVQVMYYAPAVPGFYVLRTTYTYYLKGKR